MNILITKGKDKGKRGKILKYIKDSCSYRIELENGIRTVIEVGWFEKCN